MIAYASRTGTKRNLAALRARGWRLMISARGVLRHEGFPYALDNGAWTAYQRQEPFDADAFETAYERFGDNADFVVLPDIVAGGRRSLEMSMLWLNRLEPMRCLHLIPVQDGMLPADIDGIIGPGLGIFVGGSTEWKVATIATWADTARRRNAWCHVGRVNSVKRINLCGNAGVTSFDGSSASRFVYSLPKLDNARRQLVLAGY